jgi:hypothetical protein
MAYIAVETVTTGQAGWGATWVNTFIKNNFAAGVPDIFTTKGDIVAATAADTAARLAVGADSLVLVANSGAASGVQWGAPGLIKVNDSGSQGSIWNTAVKLTQLDNEFYDLGSQWANDRFTCTCPGYYLVTCMFQYRRGGTWLADYSGYFMIYKNGAIYSYISLGVTQAASADYVLSTFGADIVYLTFGDYIEFYAISPGTTITANPNADDTSHHISITYLPS